MLHPLLAAIAPILFLCAHNADHIDLTDVGPVLFVSLAATAGLWAVAALALRSSARGACVATLAVILFFHYGHAFSLAWNSGIFPRQRFAHVTVTIVWLASGAAAATYFARAREVDRCAALMALALLIFSGSSTVRIGYHRLQSATQETPLASGAPTIGQSTPPSAPSRDAPSRDIAAPDRPDVYYIILDGYGRDDVLRDNYGFDNSHFLGQLRDKGFYVAAGSCTNYPHTYLSLSCSLSMQYLDEAAAESGNEVPFYRLIRRPRAGQILQSLGYRCVHFGTEWGGTSCSYLADVTYNDPGLLPASELTSTLQEISALRLLVNMRYRGASGHLATLSNLKQVPSMPGPTFAFAHIIAPHPPYVFDREGNVRGDIDQSQRASYIDQLVYINRRVNELLDYILAHSPSPPIIIVQSDHGPGFFAMPAGGKNGNDEEFVTERVPILNAYLAPPAMRERLYPTITPVNTFRLLLNACFDVPIELLPDRRFASRNGRPPELFEVTDMYRDGTLSQRLALPFRNAASRR